MTNWIFDSHLILSFGHLVRFVVDWYIFTFWYVVPRKIWQPCPRTQIGSILFVSGCVVRHEISFSCGQTFKNACRTLPEDEELLQNVKSVLEAETRRLQTVIQACDLLKQVSARHPLPEIGK
jgi:hypothetical protein